MIHFERWGGRINTVDEWLSLARAQNPGYRVIKFFMKTFWVEIEHHGKFLDYIGSTASRPIASGVSPPFIRERRMFKHYKYSLDITDEEYLYLKLTFDIKEDR